MNPNEQKQELREWCEQNGGSFEKLNVSRKEAYRCNIGGGSVYWDKNHMSQTGLRSSGTSAKSVGSGPNQRIESYADHTKDSISTPEIIENRGNLIHAKNPHEYITIQL